ncbi:hypothetical protein K1719_022273 [Acacia pycnantha]|nr:hypothetical protein K1719_022273 [Acacia pycnantha]
MLFEGVVFFAGALINGLAQAVWMLILGRILLGVGIGFANQKYLSLNKQFFTRAGKSPGVQALRDLRHIVTAHASTRKTVVENGGLALISSLLGPFTSHAVGSEAIVILVNLDLKSESKKNLMLLAKISLLVDVMNEGTIETKMNCAKLIEVLLMEVNESEMEILSSLSLLVGLLWAIYKLAPEKCASQAVEAGLAPKLLLVIQSGCNPVSKQMSTEFF